MRIGGLQPFTLIDYPGKLAAIVFTQGCNFRCGYCHNPQLVCPDQFDQPIDVETVLDFLKSRQGKLEGVVVTGGEPTIQKGLAGFLSRIKQMEYSIKLDTNGSNPKLLSELIELKLVDFVAMDIKTSLERYKEAVGTDVKEGMLKRSIQVIIQSGLPHQFRTTLVKSHCAPKDLESIQSLISGARHHSLQSFTASSDIIDPQIVMKEQYSRDEIQELRLMFQR